MNHERHEIIQQIMSKEWLTYRLRAYISTREKNVFLTAE